MARVPGGFGINDVMGVRRPDRSVSLELPTEKPRNWPLSDAEWDRRAGSGLVEALPAQAGQRTDPEVPDWMLNIINSTAGQILGQPSFGDMQTAFSEWAAEGLSLPTPGGAMRQPKLAGGIDEALDWVRPLALADVGVAGSAGAMMFPFPGLSPGAAPVARGVGRVGGGIRGALRRLFGGGDEAVSAVAPVVRETTEAAGRTGRPYFRNVDELEAAAQPAWEGGPTIFHGGPGDMSGFSALGEGRMIGSRPAMGNATYTTPDIQFASQYANQSVEAQSAIFRGTHSPPTPSVVQNVRFTGEGAPNLIDYGKAGIDTKAQQAVLDTLDHLDELLAAHPGTLPVLHRAELEPLLAKLQNPRTTFADIHGFASHASTGAPGITLRDIVEAVARRNTETGPFRPEQLNEMVSVVMSRLSDNLSNAGYHGFVAPADEGFHMAHTAYHGQGADKFGDSIAWFNPSKDLEIVGTAQHNVMGVVHPSGRLGLAPSGYRADNWFGSPTEVAGRLG